VCGGANFDAQGMFCIITMMIPEMFAYMIIGLNGLAMAIGCAMLILCRSTLTIHCALFGRQN